MTRAYSNDLRERLALSVAAGRSCRETAALFGVSVSTVVRCSQRWRRSGSAAARPQGGARRRVAHADYVNSFPGGVATVRQRRLLRARPGIQRKAPAVHLRDDQWQVE